MTPYILLFLLFSTSLQAQQEAYDTRPSILSVQPKQHSTLGKDWETIKRAQTEAVAMILEMYPDREIYFLARDAEMLYDMARLATKEEPSTSKRLHLLNVSRANMQDQNLKKYLFQEGISAESLKAGTKAILIDTGFSGTISKTIEDLMPQDQKGKLQTHLMASSNPEHPSTRAFLTALNPAAPDLNPGKLHGSIIQYEHLPRYTDRSTTFAQEAGKWKAMSPQQTQMDGEVSKSKAAIMMEDLSFTSQTEDFKKLLETRRAQWKKLYQLSLADNSPKVITHLQTLLNQNPHDPFIKAMVRDFLEMGQTHHLAHAPAVTAESLGLAAVDMTKKAFGNKNELIEKFPQWAAILKDPETHIPQLIHKGEFGTLAAINDVIKDVEFWTIYYGTLGKNISNPTVKTFIYQRIDSGYTRDMTGLANFGLPYDPPLTTDARQLVQALIEKGNTGTHQGLAGKVFAGAIAPQEKELLRLLIEKADPTTRRELALRLSPSYFPEMKDEIRLLIRKGGPETWQEMVKRFNNPLLMEVEGATELLLKTKDPKPLAKAAEEGFGRYGSTNRLQELRLLIENGDETVMQVLRNEVFSLDMWQKPEFESYRAAIEIPDPKKRKVFFAQKLRPSSVDTQPCVSPFLKLLTKDLSK